MTKASNLDITTSGQSSAAIRTDRGGGSVTVDGGTYTSNGLGSLAIYSTADISVSNATLTSNLSEGVCIEGLNSIKLENCDLTANNTKQNGNATFLDTIMIYQSMSGDANSGTSSFSMSGGSNIATLDATSQKLSGLVKVDNDSTLTMNLSSNSNFEGTIDGNISNASGIRVSTEVGNVSVTLDDTSTWTLTADSYVTSFHGNSQNIISNGHTLYVSGTALTGTK